MPGAWLASAPLWPSLWTYTGLAESEPGSTVRLATHTSLRVSGHEQCPGTPCILHEGSRGLDPNSARAVSCIFPCWCCLMKFSQKKESPLLEDTWKNSDLINISLGMKYPQQIILVNQVVQNKQG